MKQEKINQNIERLYNYLFYTLGCNLEEAEKISMGAIKKYKRNIKRLDQEYEINSRNGRQVKGGAK